METIFSLMLKSMNETMANASSCQIQGESQISKINEIWFWVSTIVIILIIVFGAMSNGLVIYFATHTPMVGPLRHINMVVKHLAVSDLLYGVSSCPFVIAQWKMGKIVHQLA